MENKTLMTDFYELTMAQTYFNEGKKDEQVYFDLFFRKNPFEGGYTVSGGLDETIKYIQNFKYGEEGSLYAPEFPYLPLRLKYILSSPVWEKTPSRIIEIPCFFAALQRSLKSCSSPNIVSILQ